MRLAEDAVGRAKGNQQWKAQRLTRRELDGSKDIFERGNKNKETNKIETERGLFDHCVMAETEIQLVSGAVAFIRRQIIRAVAENFTLEKVQVDTETIENYYKVQLDGLTGDESKNEEVLITQKRKVALETERQKKRCYLILETLKELAYVTKAGVEHFHFVMGIKDESDMTGANFFAQGMTKNIRNFAQLQQHAQRALSDEQKAAMVTNYKEEMSLFRMRSAAALEAHTVNSYLDTLKLDFDKVRMRKFADDPNSEMAPAAAHQNNQDAAHNQQDAFVLGNAVPLDRKGQYKLKDDLVRRKELEDASGGV